VDLTGKKQFFGIDVSAYSLDGPLPRDLPEPVNGRGRFKQLKQLAERENLSIRELILRFSTVQGHRIVVGTAKDIADQLEDWFVNFGADGYNLKPSLIPDSLDEFVDQVVPELQKRGIFRKEYEGTTLRDHLGLKRPLNQNVLFNRHVSTKAEDMATSAEGSPVGPELSAFVAEAERDTELAVKVLSETGTLSASRIFGITSRVPGKDAVVSTGIADPWKPDAPAKTSVTGFDGTPVLGKSRGGPNQFTKIFQEFPRITTVIHVHTPYLAGWASAQKPFPILYVASQRHTLVREVPVYVDRRQTQADFILDRLRENENHFVILEGNGGTTFFGSGIVELGKQVVLLEEAARFQAIAAELGGSRSYGPGVLEQQWGRTGLWEVAKSRTSIAAE
jgi:L-ribulose-5-phosphate 4-epimerase